MNVTIADKAGFCFGVRRAVNLVEKLLDQGEKVCTLGPLIHNPQMLEHFADRGVVVADTVDDISPGYRMVIRAHGVERQVLEELERRGIPYTDATCTDVEKIHKLAAQAAEQGSVVLFAGDENHPEVRGILSNCPGEHYCFSDAGELRKIVSNHPDNDKKSYILLAQTTFRVKEWQKCREIAENAYTKLKIFDTICDATMLRQNAAEELAKQSDCMIVVGGLSSSNTAKLAQICEPHCRTVRVESPSELSLYEFSTQLNIGVTAGASTPAFIIKEVHRIMSDVENNTNLNDEMSFAEMLDQSFKTINAREKVTAIVTNVSPTEIGVDIGTKHAGYVPLHEFTDDPSAKLEELVKPGDELELMVLRLNDVEGTALLSKKRLDAIAGFEKVMEAQESGEILEGIVVDVVKGGVIAVTNGVRVFIPQSQATLNRGQDLQELVRQPVQFKILETNRSRRRAVGSIRAVLRDQRKVLEDKFWETAAVGNTYQGTVKSLTSYGAFIDLGGVDGMAHISELSWSRIKHPSEVLKVGDVVEVYIKDIDPETRKISLGYKKTEDNPWEVLARDYKAGDVVTAKVVSMTPFGAFAQVIPGVDGLIHISQISNERIAKPSDVLAIGQEVQVAITDIDFDRKRVSLSIRALLDDEAQRAEEEARAAGDAPEVVAQIAPPEETSTIVIEEAAPVEEPVVTEEAAPETEAPEEAPAEEAPAESEK
ncbi:MAG: bifunctional 4-hydroxy-3-methylbut-2-enyl diphosphate reductase/30S ribosomal protein S1 [Oscillospiraceae bacterium]